jgi:hypothetical protein
MRRAMLGLIAGLSLTGGRALADLRVAWLPVSAPGLPEFTQSSEAGGLSGDQEALWNSVVFRHPLERLANVRGEGCLRVLENGSIVIVIEALGEGAEEAAADRRILRMVPGAPEETAALPDVVGQISVAYSAAEEVATVHANGELLFYFTVLREVGSSTTAIAEGYTVHRGVEFSTRRLSPEATKELPIALIEAVLGGQLPAESLVSVGDWRAAALELQQLLSDPGKCDNCQAGGRGASGCGISCPGSPDDCAVTCTTGYYACCKCINAQASCVCCSE